MNPAKVKYRILASVFGMFCVFMLVSNFFFLQQNYRSILSQIRATYALKYDSGKDSTRSGLLTLKSLKNTFVEALENHLDFVLARNHCRSFFIQIYGLTQKKVIDPFLIHDDNYCFIRLKNGHLSILCKKKDYSQEAQEMVRFSQILSKQNIPFVFILAPNKIHQNAPMVETGVTDFSNENADSYLEILRRGKIEILDCREIFEENPKTHYDLFYKPDTHWKTEYAFLAYQKLAPILQKHGLEVLPDSLHKENYELVYSGQKNDIAIRLGNWYLKPEPQQFMQPKWETSLKLVPHWNPAKYSGHYSAIELEHASSNVTVFNQKAHNPTKVFFFSDSFGRNFSTFLPFICSHLEIRIMNEYSGNMLQEIEEFHPDLVIGMFTARDTYYHCEKFGLDAHPAN